MGVRKNEVLMTKHWTPFALVWLALAVVGLVGTWYFNIGSIAAGRNYFGDWISGGPSVSSLAVDFLVVVVACVILIVAESRRIGMRFSWVYIVLSAVTAVAFAFPLFLAMRERHIAAARTDAASTRTLDR